MGLLLWPLATIAQEPALISGPTAGSKAGAASCYALTGPLAGQEFDAMEKIGSAPGALLFIHDLSRNTAPVIRKLDELGHEHSLLGFQWFSIMLNDDRTEGEAMLKRVNGSLKLHNPLILSLDGLEGPGDYALNRKCTLTLVLMKEGVVTESIALTDTGMNDFPKLEQWVESVAGTMPKGDEALRALMTKNLPDETRALKDLAVNQMLEIRRLRTQLAKARQNPGRQMGGRGENMRQREGGPKKPEEKKEEPGVPKQKREGKPPEDGELNGLLRAFIRQTNDDARADEVYADIIKRAAESDDLKGEAVEMFKLMLSFRDRYGTAHAQGLAEGFLKEHAPNKD
ncbi:MAG: hypothetical protein ACKVHP_17640 [Verrucomicrobiales bacterium]